MFSNAKEGMQLGPEARRKVKIKTQNVKLWNPLRADDEFYLYAYIQFYPGRRPE